MEAKLYKSVPRWGDSYRDKQDYRAVRCLVATCSWEEAATHLTLAQPDGVIVISKGVGLRGGIQLPRWYTSAGVMPLPRLLRRHHLHIAWWKE